MLFNSLAFLIFLPVVFALYWLVRQRRLQNLTVVVASYVFYGWWDWRFLVLIAFTSLCSFGSGLLLDHFEGSRLRRQAVSAANIIVNLGILAIFKYYNFFVENLDALLSATLNCHLDWVTLQVVLPVGISFYTFQALSYSIDVYRGDIRATRDPAAFFAYISFFPQLVAGPIERATNLLPQFQQSRRFDHDKAIDGMRQMLWGFVKKIVVADSCAQTVNMFWNDYASLDGLSLLMLALLFTLQIYCDFSGYSDIAIGCARLFGFNLKRNFNYPYFSQSIADFWRRWHISLMTWMRDYIYIPLGGNRQGEWKTLRNIFIVWTVSGLWHGAAWTFVCWGLYHAVLLAVGRHTIVHGRPTPSRLKTLLQALLTFTLVLIGWIIFRAESMSQAIGFIAQMFTALPGSHIPAFGKNCLLCGLLVTGIEWLQRDKQHALQFSGFPFNHRWTRWAVYYALLVLIALNVGKEQTFIYFQF